MGPVLSHTPFADLTDVNLADEDTNSILCAIWWPNLQPMQVAPSLDFESQVN